MLTKSTVFEAKNARAVSILKSWLREVGISYRVSFTPNCDLLVTSSEGVKKEVQITAGDSGTAPEGAVVLQAGVLTGRRIQAAMEAFAAFQRTLGYEAKTPVDRGQLPDKKLDYKDNFEAVAMRHTELRRSPNPTAKELSQYDVVLKKATWNFLRLNTQLCQDHVHSFEDLFTYAQTWLVVYLGYYQVPAEQDKESNNEKKLYAYLWQRFGEFRSLLNKKRRNVLAGMDTASIGQFNEPYRYNCGQGEGKYFGYLDRKGSSESGLESDDTDESYVARHNELDLRSPNTRRTSAAANLEARLAALPHDEMMETLKTAMENDRLHIDASREARKRLAEHIHGCALCTHLSPPGLEEDEDVPKVDPRERLHALGRLRSSLKGTIKPNDARARYEALNEKESAPALEEDEDSA